MIQLIYFDPRNGGRRFDERIQSVEELVQRLRELENENLIALDAPLGVSILNGSDDFMSIGLAGTEWVVCHTRMKAGSPESQLCASGNDSAGGVIAFYFEQWTEFPRSALVPRAVAERAVKEWLATGKLSESVRWVSEGQM